MPLLRSTQAPSAMPARPLTETTELTASSDSDRREISRRAEHAEHQLEQHDVAGAREQLQADPRGDPAEAFASAILSAAERSPGTASSSAATSAKKTARLIDAVAQRARLRGHSPRRRLRPKRSSSDLAASLLESPM